MKSYLFLLCSFLLFACSSEPKENVTTTVSNPDIEVNYPETKKQDISDDYHGTEVEDPYRWLEVDTAAEVEEWVAEQNKVTFAYLEKIPFRKKVRERYEELFNYPKLSSPYQAGEYYFFEKNDGLQNQSVIYYQKGLDGEPEVFIDPNALSKDGTVAINLIGFSKDDRYVAYSQSEAGSDWQQIRVMEIETKEELDDVLEWVKFSGAAWHEDGFFYSRFPEPASGMELSANNKYHSVYYHKLGDDQSEDKLIYEDRENPFMYHWCGTSENEDYLVVYAAPGTDGFATYVKDIRNEGPMITLFEGYANKSTVVKYVDGRFLCLTDIDAPKYRLVSVDPENPAQENWVEVIPEKENLLNSVSTGGGKMFTNYLENARTKIYRYDLDGSNEVEIKLPGTGSADGFKGKEDHDILFYTYSSFVYPPSIFKYDVESGRSDQFFKSELKFNPEDFVEKQVTYKSKDGTSVSMFVVHKKDLEKNGENPAYLYGYGGFNVSLTPWFSTSKIMLLENGVVYAIPNLRGGGEYGEEWHRDGMLLNKQNVFDDFIAAAEYLISEGYTSSDRLAIGGGSNGGLLVGACMTQRPDLFAVALPAVGVMDMLRYDKFTVGQAWAAEYGSSDDPEHFRNLMSYSPLHNLEDGTDYPATLITTGDHDDRVVPAHSFKFAARLQEAHSGNDPVLIRIETDAGHGAGKPTSKILDEQADIWSFFFYNTNSPVKYLEG